jgi:hypothetical protein
MALTTADFIHPTGELTADLYPGDELDVNVAAWLAQAVGLTDDEAKQRHWVLYRAYGTVANRFHAGLASESKGPASAARSDGQFRFWAGKAMDHLRAYHAGAQFEPVL